MKIYSYNPGSESAKALAEALGIKRIKHEGKDLNLKQSILINWGASKIERVMHGIKQILNMPECVAKATNKLHTFKALEEAEVSIPEFTTNKEEAIGFLQDGKDRAIVCRTKLTGHSGEGIVIAETAEQVVDAPLYTLYIKKKEEYRIHVMHGEAFFVQRKARKLEVADDQVNWKVRNLAGGFIFANKDVEVAEEAKQQAIMAVDALGLDFGAVDIIWNEKENKYYVLEVNTACGLEGTTLEKYVEQFKKYL